MAESDKIAPTAHYTAYAWRRLDLPYSELYATPLGAGLYWSLRGLVEWPAWLAPRAPTMVQYLAHRHLTLDHLLAEIAPDRVVELGAGLSRRGTTWAADRDTRYVEVDLPAMIARKRAAVDARAPAAVREALERNWSQTSTDVLDEGFGDVLAGLLAGARRPAVVSEGLIGYFPPAERARLIGAVRRGLSTAGGGSYLTDVHTAEAQDRIRGVRVVRSLIRALTRGHGVKQPWRDEAEARAAFAAAGFDEVETREPRHLVGEIPGLAPVDSPVLIVRATAGP